MVNIKNEVTESMITAGKIIDWAKTHPKQSIPTGLVSAVLVRTMRKRHNANIGNYSATITRGQQSPPSGSAAGMNAEPSAWIQGTDSGYDNPSYQGERYGFDMSSYQQPNLPVLARPEAMNDVSSVADYRYDTDDMNKDQLYSRMI